MYRQICLQGQLLRSRAFSYSLGTRQWPPWKPCVNVDSSCFSSQKESQRVTPSRNNYLEQCRVEGGPPRNSPLEQWGVGDTPETSTWNNEGWGHTPETATNSGGWRRDTPETATWNSGVGDTPHLLVCTPTETAHPGGEDFTNHQLRRRTGGKDKRTEQGEMLFRLLAFISTFSEAFIFYLTKNETCIFQIIVSVGCLDFSFLILSF